MRVDELRRHFLRPDAGYMVNFTWIVGISSLGKFLFLETLIKSLSKLWSEMKSRFLNHKEARKSSWLIWRRKMPESV